MKTLILLCILCYATAKADKPWQFLNKENTIIIHENSKIYFCLSVPKRATIYFDFQTPSEESQYIRKDSLNNPLNYAFKNWEYIALRENQTLRFTSTDTDSIPAPDNSFHPWDIRVYEVERKYSVDSSRTIVLQQNTYLLETDVAVILYIYITALIPFVALNLVGIFLRYITLTNSNQIISFAVDAGAYLIILLIAAIIIAAIKYGTFLIIIYPIFLFCIPFFIEYVIIFFGQCIDFEEIWTDIKNYFKKK